MRIALNGYVVASADQWIYDWFGIEAFSPATVRQALADNPEGEVLVFEINSGGGDVWAGNEIYTVLRSAEGVATRAEIQSIAASAASYLCLGCDTVVISPVAQMMVHLPSTFTEGDRTEHLRSVQMLDATRESILNAYELKAGERADRAHMRRLMNAQTWITAQEAADLGLVDGIMFADESVSPQVVNAMGAGVRAIANSAAPVRDAQSLRARYEQLVRDGAAPADGHPVLDPAQPPEHSAPSGGTPETIADDWTRRARLAIEKSRWENIKN